MVTLTPEGTFAVIAGIVALGFVVDYFFERTRVTSILPLMLLGLFFVQAGLISPGGVSDLKSISGFVSAFAVAVILLTVGLEINVARLYRVIGRAIGWTLACQFTTGIALGFLAYYTTDWALVWCMVFGFAVSGPSSIVVQALVRRMVMKEELKTTLLFEAVVSDVLQLVVPTVLILIWQKGSVSGSDVAGIVSLAVLGSIALGIAAGLLWVWALSKGQRVSAGYTWALTFTIALGLYSVTAYTGLTGSLVIFIFGVIVGNAALLDLRRGTDARAAKNRTDRWLIGLRRALRIPSADIDVDHIHQIQTEITYIVGVFFFFYIGTLFVAPAPGFSYWVPAAGVAIIVAIRWGFVPILNPLFDTARAARRQQRELSVFNVPRGLSAAVVAALVESLGVNVPYFLDTVFITIIFTNVVVTLAVFFFYRSTSASEPKLQSPTGPTTSAPVPSSDTGIQAIPG